MQILSLSSVGLCIALWIRAKTVDQDERGNAERRALFVGLWPPTIWLIGDSLRQTANERLMSRRESALSDPRQARYGSEEQRVMPRTAAIARSWAFASPRAWR